MIRKRVMKMDVRYSKKFVKEYKKANSKIQAAFEMRQKLFMQDPLDPRLHNHSLKGRYVGTRSINITGDWRAVYAERFLRNSNSSFSKVITFEALGTHSQLYK